VFETSGTETRLQFYTQKDPLGIFYVEAVKELKEAGLSLFSWFQCKQAAACSHYCTDQKLLWQIPTLNIKFTGGEIEVKMLNAPEYVSSTLIVDFRKLFPPVGITEGTLILETGHWMKVNCRRPDEESFSVNLAEA
jgi:hypothetical protein